MTTTKAEGDLAELMVAADLTRQGYPVAFPYGEDCDYDLIVDRCGRLERIQVKYADSKGHVIAVQCYSSSLTNGKSNAESRTRSGRLTGSLFMTRQPIAATTSPVMNSPRAATR